MRIWKPRIRVTEISLGMRCAMAFYFLKTIGPVPPSGSMTIGSGFHKAMDVNFKEKAKSGLDAPDNVCTDAFNDYYKEWLLDTEWREDDPAKLNAAGIKMVRAAKKDVTPPIEVASEEDVERNFILDVGDFEISGTVDLIRPELVGLIDFKSGKQMWYQGRADNEVQGFLYPHLAKSIGSELLLPFEFKVITHTGRSGTFPVRHSRKGAEYIVRVARRLLRMVENREEPNVNTGHYLCSDKYCGWRSYCPLFS